MADGAQLSPAGPALSGPWRLGRRVERDLSATGYASRLELIQLICILGWSGFALQYALFARWGTVVVDLLVVLAVTGAFAWTRWAREMWALQVASHTTLGINLIGIVVGAMLSGQGEAMALWFLAGAPLFAAYLTGARAAAIWTAACALALVGVHLSSRIAGVEPEFVATGPEVLGGQVALVLVVLGFALASRRRLDAQLHRLEERAAELEDVAAAAEQQRREVEELKNDFVASVTHELRTPITAISGSLHLLEASSGSTLPAKQVRMLSMARDNVARLDRIVSKILDVQQAQQGRLRIERAPTDLVPLVQEIVAEHIERAEDVQVVLDFGVKGRPAKLSVDPTRITQVLFELLDNALRHAPSASTIAVDLEAIDGGVRVSVADEGTGISPALREELFQPFRQRDVGLTRRPGGAGLGLTVVQAIVDAHGGEIGVTEASAGGAKVWFSLPLDPETPIAGHSGV